MSVSTVTVCFLQLTSSEPNISRIGRQPVVAFRRMRAVVQSMSIGVEDGRKNFQLVVSSYYTISGGLILDSNGRDRSPNHFTYQKLNFK